MKAGGGGGRYPVAGSRAAGRGFSLHHERSVWTTCYPRV